MIIDTLKQYELANGTGNVDIWSGKQGDNEAKAKVEQAAAIKLDDKIDTVAMQALARAVQMQDITYKHEVGFLLTMLKCLGPLFQLSALLHKNTEVTITKDTSQIVKNALESTQAFVEFAEQHDKELNSNCFKADAETDDHTCLVFSGLVVANELFKCIKDQAMAMFRLVSQHFTKELTDLNTTYTPMIPDGFDANKDLLIPNGPLQTALLDNPNFIKLGAAASELNAVLEDGRGLQKGSIKIIEARLMKQTQDLYNSVCAVVTSTFVIFKVREKTSSRRTKRPGHRQPKSCRSCSQKKQQTASLGVDLTDALNKLADDAPGAQQIIEAFEVLEGVVKEPAPKPAEKGS